MDKRNSELQYVAVKLTLEVVLQLFDRQLAVEQLLHQVCSNHNNFVDYQQSEAIELLSIMSFHQSCPEYHHPSNLIMHSAEELQTLVPVACVFWISKSNTAANAFAFK